MPALDDIEYSRDSTIAAIRDYYGFLTQLYLDNSKVHEPPPGGWPSITLDSMRPLGKTDEVILLLRHLPYIEDDLIQGAAFCVFANWQVKSLHLAAGVPGEDIRLTSEGTIYEDVPPHVVSITGGESRNPVFLLDTKLGIIHFCECPGEIRYNPSRELIADEVYDCAPENEQDWRADSPAWAIEDFFELLKDQFRKLSYIPMDSRNVMDIYATVGPNTVGMVPMLQRIYREHGWPDPQRYQKRECMEAVQRAFVERYPDSASIYD